MEAKSDEEIQFLIDDARNQIRTYIDERQALDREHHRINSGSGPLSLLFQKRNEEIRLKTEELCAAVGDRSLQIVKYQQELDKRFKKVVPERRGGSSSSTVISTAVRKVEHEKAVKLQELRHQYEKSKAEVQLKINQLKKKIEKKDGDLEGHRAQIADFEEKLDELTTTHARELTQMEEHFQLKVQGLEIDEDEKREQLLGVDDNEAIKDWNRRNTLPSDVSGLHISPSQLKYEDPYSSSLDHQFPQGYQNLQHCSGYQYQPYPSVPPPTTTLKQSTMPPAPIHATPVRSSNFQQQPLTPSERDDVMLKMMQSQQILADAQLKFLQQKDNRLPDFSGDPAQWSAFHNAFERTKDASNISRDMRRLQGALKGQARTMVEYLFGNDFNVPFILDILKKQYGRPEVILDHLVEQARACKAPDPNKPMSLVEFGTIVSSLECNIRTYGKMEYMYNPLLVQELVKKLPGNLREDWCKNLLSGGQSTMQNFATWLTYHVSVARLQLTAKDFQTTEKSGKKDKGSKCSIQAASEEKPKLACYICGKPRHYAYQCETFKKLSVDDRWDKVREKKLCFMCFSPHHGTKDCERKPCPKDGCGRKHHALLHSSGKGSNGTPKEKKNRKKDRDSEDEAEESDEEIEQIVQHVKKNTENKNSSAGSKGSTAQTTEAIAVAYSNSNLPIVPVFVNGPKGRKRIYAFLDCGASCSLIEEDIADELSLPGDVKPLSLEVFGKKTKGDPNSRSVSLKVVGDFRHAEGQEMANVRTIKKIGVPPRNLNVEEMKEKYSHLRKVPMKNLRNAVPRMVVGFDYMRLIRPNKWFEEKDKNTPCAYRCSLGWYMTTGGSERESLQWMLQQCSNEDLHQQIKDYFTTESFGVKPSVLSTRSKEDLEAEGLMNKHTVWKNGKWETCLLFKDERMELPESKTMALNRLRTMEKKMDRDPEFAKLCCEKFDDYLSKGYLKERKRTKESTPTATEKKRSYLPWFFAFNPNKKPRLVFDAAAKSHGKCLNDFLMKGPDLIQSLPAVLTRFRLHQIALCGDIKEMFHQVGLRKEDRPAQTVLYRGMSRAESPKEYEMTVLFFGSASSPSSAIFTKNRNAHRFRETYPKAVEVTEFEMYVDDLCTGSEAEESAIQLFQEVNRIHEEGGFPLVKWNSSSTAVLDQIPNEIKAHGEVSFSNKDDIPSEKTLGLWWNPATDEFSFKLSLAKVPEKVIDGSSHPTKRQMCSIVMSLFDPLGFVAPLKVKGMIILQNIWRSGIGWDDEVSADVNDQWRKWLEELKKVTTVQVPRKLSKAKLSEATDLQLHTFCDASADAFAAVTYLRVQNEATVEVNVVMGKVRVAPLRGLTIPRMELQAAVMGSRLTKTVLEAFRGKLNISRRVMWSDSKTVLCWIRNSEQRYNPFIGNRVGEIIDLTDVSEWRWVPTKQNVADDATRLSAVDEENLNSRWLTGSEFLMKREEDWPIEKFASTAVSSELEEFGMHLLFEKEADSPYLPDVLKYSSWMKLLRATAMRYVAARRFRKISPYYLTGADLKRARTEWIKESQRKPGTFSGEVKLLLEGRPIPPQSRIVKLSPTINRDGILVFGGRIDKAELPEETVHPPILDPDDPYTKLMVQWYHDTSHHFGQERVINELRKSVWIINCRGAVRACKFNCMICKKNAAKPVPPLMGQLPVSRVEMGKHPFYKTGVDFFGPLIVQLGRKTRGTSGTAKRYGVLFTCMATRATHLELADSLEADEFIKVLTRFVNRRGEPKEIWSDNGTNFVGAEREMRDELAKWDKQTLSDAMLKRGVTWIFNNPASPHMGGSWESPIKLVKRILYQLVKEHYPKESDLRTFLTEVEAILNSRPLTRISPDPNDQEALSPNHLLNVPCVLGPSIPGEDTGKDFRRSWKHVQKLSREFWKRFATDYLPWLAKRHKWIKEAKPLAVGDVVVLLEDNAQRNDWKTGLITEVDTAKDGQVRRAEVKICQVDPEDPKKTVKTSHLWRPAIKICPLNLQSGEFSQKIRRENGVE